MRAPDLLDRLTRLRTVLFDKTGTLTLGRLDLVEPHNPGQLAPEVRDVAYRMTTGSNHPVSRCLARALAGAGARVDEPLQSEEIPGRGLELVRDGRRYRLGAPGWAVPGASAAPGATLLSMDGAPLARFVTREAVRPGAQRQLARLRAAGLEVWLLSGDARGRVEEFGRALGLPNDRVLGELSPDRQGRGRHPGGPARHAVHRRRGERQPGLRRRVRRGYPGGGPPGDARKVGRLLPRREPGGSRRAPGRSAVLAHRGAPHPGHGARLQRAGGDRGVARTGHPAGGGGGHARAARWRSSWPPPAGWPGIAALRRRHRSCTRRPRERADPPGVRAA